MTKHFVWDRLVRVTHWSVAALFLANYLVTEEGSDIHEWVGYSVVGLVVIRLLWGIIASPPARLSSFLPSPRSALQHLKQVFETREDQHTGHNPAGSVMIWCMWIGLLMTGLSGYLMETDQFWGEDWVEEFHELAANLTFAFVCIHVTAIAVMSRVTGNSYIRSMLWKQKRH